MSDFYSTGAVALLKSKKPDITFQEIQDAIYPNTHRVEMGEIVCNGGGNLIKLFQ